MNKINLEWYVLNGCKRSGTRKEFESYPFCFYETEVRPWNVFNNYPFREAAISLAKDYYNGKFTLDTLEKENIKCKTNYEAFVYELMRLLSWQEHGRYEYEICVADWAPVYLNKNGERIDVYSGKEHEPIDDVAMDKIDCYTQVYPNRDIFAKYVLLAVNGTLETKSKNS